MSNLRSTYSRVALTERAVYQRRVTDDGLLGGNWNMIGNYSGGPVDFWCEPDIAHALRVTRITLLVSDSGSIGDADYGGLPGGLSSGMRFFSEVGGVRQYSETTLWNNIDLIGAADAFRIHVLTGSERVLVYQRFLSPDSDSFTISDIPSARFGVTVEDDLTLLQHHGLWISGSQQLARVAQWAMLALIASVPFILNIGGTI